MRRLLPLFAAGLTVAAALLWADRLRLAPIDDAYITFRAAVNLAHGDGPVFNVGERVESATSPLWVALLAVAERLGIGPVAASTPLLLAFAAGAAALAAVCALELGGPLAAVIAGVALAALPSWSAWVCTGMEVPLAGFFITAATLAALRERAGLAGMLLAAAALSRPEAIALLPAFLVALPRDRWPRFLALALAPVLLLTFARRAWFGQWVPNTYVAKREGLGLAGLGRGLGYVGAFAVANLALVAAAGAALFRRRARLLALVCLCFGAAVAWDGGDHFSLWRLMGPVLPVGCAILGVELAALPRKLVPVAAALAIAAAVALPPLLGLPSLREGLAGLTAEGLYAEQALDAVQALWGLPPGRVAAVSIGIVGFVSGRNVLDMVGLANPHIARTPHLPGVAPGHDHADVDYVLSQKPELVMLVPQLSSLKVSVEREEAWLSYLDHHLRAARLLQADPRFRAAYEPLDLRDDRGRWLHLWRLRP
jgi:hypothetical protein